MKLLSLKHPTVVRILGLIPGPANMLLVQFYGATIIFKLFLGKVGQRSSQYFLVLGEFEILQLNKQSKFKVAV
jgi:hypothetical protein